MQRTTPIPHELRNFVERELEPDEQTVWMEMPTARFFTPGAAGMFIFAIFWTSFAIFWTFGAAGFKIPDFKDGADFFPLFGLPFILIGIGLLSTPVWFYKKAKRTVYVITDRRAIIFDGGWRTSTIRSYPPRKLHNIFRRERRDGSGSVILERIAQYDNDNQNMREEYGFMNIRNVREVERMLRELAETRPA
jgi:hypothetical protein